MPEQDFCIYIPSYNAAEFLEKTVSRIPFENLPDSLRYRVLFVDNASTDNTWSCVEASAGRLRQRGVEVDAIRHPVNRGYGGTVKSAFDYCVEKDIDFAAVLHADGQYAPELLPELILQLLRNGNAALHFGSRLTGEPLKGGMPVYKYIGNLFLSGIQNIVMGTSLSEFHSGYRLYRVSKLKQIPYRLNSDGFVFDNQIIFQIHHAGFDITESPIPTYYGKEKSHVPRIGTPLAILGGLWEYAMHMYGIRRVPRYDFQISS